MAPHFSSFFFFLVFIGGLWKCSVQCTRKGRWEEEGHAWEWGDLEDEWVKYGSGMWAYGWIMEFVVGMNVFV